MKRIACGYRWGRILIRNPRKHEIIGKPKNEQEDAEADQNKQKMSFHGFKFRGEPEEPVPTTAIRDIDLRSSETFFCAM